MRLESRLFQLAKDADHPEENQDACSIDAERGVAAIADGVSSGIFSRRWAAILAEHVVADLPDPRRRAEFKSWLARQRAAWQRPINAGALAWHQKPKLREGAFSTLLWVQLLEGESDDSEAMSTCRLRGMAVGDSCLFVVRGGEVLHTFPIQTAEQLEASPLVIGSVDLNRDELLEFASFDQPCRDGDLLVLTTDAVAEWALRRIEAGNPPTWEDYWQMPEAAWHQEVAALRHERQMRYDDATLLLLRVCREAATASSEREGAAERVSPNAEVDQTGPARRDTAGEDQWPERFKALSEHVSAQVSRVMEKFKQVKESARLGLKKYRDTLREDR